MNTIGTRLTNGVIESVKGSWEPGQDEKTVITTCSAKTVKWSNVSERSMEARRPNGQNLYGSIEAFVRDEGRRSLIGRLLRVSVNDVVELARSEIRPRIVEDLSDEELIQRISAAARDASHALQVVPEEIPIVAGAGSGGNSGISSASNASQRSMAARRPNEQSLYRSIQAFVRDRNQGGLLPRMLQFTVTHAGLVELARSEIRPRVVDSLSDEELIQQISAAVRDTSQVVPEAIPMVARAGTGGDSSISSVSMHQAEGNHAVELENRSLGTFSSGTGAEPADDDVIGG